MSFARWIRETRLAKGMQVSECALRAGVGQSTWSVYESSPAKKEWRKATVCRIADALDVAADIALFEAGILPREEPDIEIARRLGPIVGRAAASKRGQIVDTLAEIAERMVGILSETGQSVPAGRKTTHNSVLCVSFEQTAGLFSVSLPGLAFGGLRLQNRPGIPAL